MVRCSALAYFLVGICRYLCWNVQFNWTFNMFKPNLLFDSIMPFGSDLLECSCKWTTNKCVMCNMPCPKEKINFKIVFHIICMRIVKKYFSLYILVCKIFIHDWKIIVCHCFLQLKVKRLNFFVSILSGHIFFNMIKLLWNCLSPISQARSAMACSKCPFFVLDLTTNDLISTLEPAQHPKRPPLLYHGMGCYRLRPSKSQPALIPFDMVYSVDRS